jgi:triacylglycerol lipase
MTPQDAAKAATMAQLAARAYGDVPTVGDARSASRMHVYDGVHVFRGTDDVSSVLADIDISMVDVPGLGRLHAGFYAAVATILPACQALPRPTAIAGHSLGAAMAAIYAGIWALQGWAVPVYAFEPPKLCGDDTLAALLRDKGGPWLATRNGRDLVTQVPATLTLPGALTPIGRALLPFDNIGDHSIAHVVATLQELAVVA